MRFYFSLDFGHSFYEILTANILDKISCIFLIGKCLPKRRKK